MLSCDVLVCKGGIVVILFKYECRVGHLFVLSWAMVRWVALGSIVSEGRILSGIVFVTLLCFLLLRNVMTMVVCMCFIFAWICALFTVLGFMLMSVVYCVV